MLTTSAKITSALINDLVSLLYVGITDCMNHWRIRNYNTVSNNNINALMIVNLRFRVTLTGVLKLPMMLSAQMVLRTAKLHTSLEFIGSSNEHVAEDNIVGL